MDDDTSKVVAPDAQPEAANGAAGRRRRRREGADPVEPAPDEGPTGAPPARRRKPAAGRAEPAGTAHHVGDAEHEPSSKVADARTGTRRRAAKARLRRLGVRPAAAAVAVVLGLGVGGILAVDDEAGPTVAEYAAGQGGEVLVARDGGFRARFPATPSRRTQSVQVDGAGVPVVDYTGSAGGQTFTVSYAELPEGQDVGDPILRLNASATAATEAVKGKLEAAGITSFLGQPAVEYLIAVDGRYVKATSFLAGRRIYGIEVVGPDNPPAGYDRFRDTFELTG
ncbi:MAG: hypothetical protein ACRD0N_10570 [Acidimicrobiales bacterium]